MNDDRCRLYLITPPRLDDVAAFAAELEAALGAGDVACLQLRLKDASDDVVLTTAAALLPLCHAHDVALIINDRPDLAIQASADGVHVGQDDTPYHDAREALGPDRIVGVTCHDNRHLAMAAGEAGADYVAFGAFFHTATKVPKSHAEMDLLEWWATFFTVPCVAIGGITLENAATVVKAGADFIAVSGGVWSYPGGAAEAVWEFNTLIDDAMTARTITD